MGAAEIYRKANITNQEFMTMLHKLGFTDVSDNQQFRFIHTKKNSEITLPIRPLSEYVQRVYLAAYAYRLYMQGIIKNEDAFMTMLDKMHLKNPQKSA